MVRVLVARDNGLGEPGPVAFEVLGTLQDRMILKRVARTEIVIVSPDQAELRHLDHEMPRSSFAVISPFRHADHVAAGGLIQGFPDFVVGIRRRGPFPRSTGFDIIFFRLRGEYRNKCDCKDRNEKFNAFIHKKPPRKIRIFRRKKSMATATLPIFKSRSGGRFVKETVRDFRNRRRARDIARTPILALSLLI